METLEGDIKTAKCSRVAWAAAVEQFDGQGLTSDEVPVTWGWIAAGMLDEHGELADDWRRALAVAQPRK